MSDDFDEATADRAALDRQENRFRGAIALAADALSMIGGPSALLQRAAENAVKKRRDAAREILMEELRKAQVPFEDAIIRQVDESAAIVLRYMRAADEGVRTRNLRLLARAFRRQLETDQASAERFQQTAAAIETLTDTEIGLLARWLVARRSISFQDILQTYPQQDWVELNATAAALIRTGLVMPDSGLSGLAYSLTPAAFRLSDELSLEDEAD